MRHYVAAALWVMTLADPAAAVDLGVGIQAGDVGAGTSLGAGRERGIAWAWRKPG